MDPEISMKSLRVARNGGDVFSFLQEGRRRQVNWGEKKNNTERNSKMSEYINRKQNQDGV